MNKTNRTNRTNRSEYAAGYAARVNNLPIPASVSRQWAKGCRDAWKEAHA